MTNLGSVVTKTRSKNVWITVDIFCGSEAVFNRVCGYLAPTVAAVLIGHEAVVVRRFEISDLLVLKLSFARHHVKGSCLDRDMHGTQIATLFAELDFT